MLPGLRERNPGLELANAFSVRDQEFSHSLFSPVMKIRRNDPEPFLTVSSASIAKQTVETVPSLSLVPSHRAEATVLMRSLRAPLWLFIRSHCVVWLRLSAALCLGGECFSW